MHAVSAAKNTHIMARRSQRRSIALPGRVTWKDARGTTRFASVVTRDVSDTGVFIEWRESTSIPLYRLVTFQLERDARTAEELPPALQQALGAVRVAEDAHQIIFHRQIEAARARIALAARTAA